MIILMLIGDANAAFIFSSIYEISTGEDQLALGQRTYDMPALDNPYENEVLSVNE